MEVSGGTVSIDDAVNEGLVMYSKVRAFISSLPDKGKDGKEPPEAALKELHDRLVKDHKDFASSYPIVTRVMVFEGFYVPKVMKNYFVHISNHPWKTREEFLERQAEYLVYVLRYRCPRTETKKIHAYRNEMIKKLKQEDAEFIEAFKAIGEQMDKEMGQSKDDRRERILEMLRAGIPGTPSPETPS